MPRAEKLKSRFRAVLRNPNTVLAEVTSVAVRRAYGGLSVEMGVRSSTASPIANGVGSSYSLLAVTLLASKRS